MRPEMEVARESILSRSKGGMASPMNITLKQARAVVRAGADALDRDPSVLDLVADFVVVGDIHGSTDSLLGIFSRLGYPPERSYLFLGDYVDRGLYSIEVILMLYALKAAFPSHVFLLRGNHECESLTPLYGFRHECQAR